VHASICRVQHSNDYQGNSKARYKKNQDGVVLSFFISSIDFPHRLYSLINGDGRVSSGSKWPDPQAPECPAKAPRQSAGEQNKKTLIRS
jgi:hypothetical protein